MLKKNMSGTERVIRAALGIVILGFGFWHKSLWGLVGLIPMFTAAIGSCPAYLPFGFSTRKDC